MVGGKCNNQRFLAWLLLSGYRKGIVGEEGLAVVIAEVVAPASVGIADFGG